MPKEKTGQKLQRKKRDRDTQRGGKSVIILGLSILGGESRRQEFHRIIALRTRALKALIGISMTAVGETPRRTMAPGWGRCPAGRCAKKRFAPVCLSFF